MTNLLANLPRLGAGLAYREPLRDELLQKQPEVDFVEIIGDHYLDAPPERMEELALLGEHFTLVPHFTNLSLGSAEGIDPAYLEKIAALIKRLNPPWWSEHIGFTRAGGVSLGHPAPLPFTREAIDVMTRNVIATRRAIATPLILENVCSPLLWPGAEMSEPVFISEVLGFGGCGMLLDVTNLLTQSTNHGGSPQDFLDRLPLDRVVQVHFSGGHEAQGRLVESHAQPVAEAVWKLLDSVVARAPVRCICLERDDNLPPLPEMLWEVERARAIGRQHRRWN
ncbi:MAG: DUF692 domain-containing protein [Verrucomicrobia bacterium]|nr:DUF692 domain-containing protein [Verrucomicrobiota bacterium]